MTMQEKPLTTDPIRPTLQDVLDGLNRNSALSNTRRRDLKSAVNCFATLTDSTPALIPLDLAEIRAVLDLNGADPGQGVAKTLGEPAQRSVGGDRRFRPAANGKDCLGPAE